MFGTIILDSYKINEAKMVADYIDEICSPMDSVGWSSSGIYSFWDYYTKEILYIGLASDLNVRFKQHNGLLNIDESACKIQELRDYFSKKDRVGYSILVQSTMSQPIVHRNKELFLKFLKDSKGDKFFNYAGEEGLEHIRQAEGQLIESYKRVVGDIPPWNKIGGDKFSRKFASKSNYLYVVKEFAKGNIDNILVSKSTIRELAENPTYEWFEVQLHALRIMMINFHITFEEAVSIQKKNNPYFEAEWDRIVESGYLSKELNV